MMRLSLALFGLIWMSACTDTTRVPSDIIPQKKMENIMWDMLRADRFVNIYYPPPTDSQFNKVKAFKVYEGVFKIHGISKDEFLKSYKFYLGRPDLSRTMFDSITSRAERRRADIYKLPATADSTRRDSISTRLRKLKADSARLDSVRTRLLRGRQPRRDSLK